MSTVMPNRTVVFVCQHGAAKSVLAAAYLSRLAAARGLPVRAEAAGTEPDPEVAPRVAAALRAEGLALPVAAPRRVTREELAAAWRIVSFGPDLTGLVPPDHRVTRWDDVPALSEDFEAGRAAILARLPSLLED